MEWELLVAVNVVVSGHADNLLRCEAELYAHAIEEHSGLTIVSRLSPGSDVADNENGVNVTALLVHLLYVFKHSLAYGAVDVRFRREIAVSKVNIGQVEEAQVILLVVVANALR